MLLISESRDKLQDRRWGGRLEDGRGFCTKFTNDYLGAIKQMPIVMRELNRLMPRLTHTFPGGHDGNAELAQRECERYGIDLQITPQKTRRKAINITLTVHKQPFSAMNDSQNSTTFSTWIDPLKFEDRPLINEERQRTLRKEYGVTPEEIVIVGGSLDKYETHELARSYEIVKGANRKAQWRVIIVPSWHRGVHLTHAQNIIKKGGLITDGELREGKNGRIVFVEQRGVLDEIYAIADLALIGSTMTPGSSRQNPIEPAFYGKRILAGPYGRNNQVAFEGLRQSGLLTIVENSNAIAREMLREPSEQQHAQHQRAAAEFIASQRGTAEKFARYVQSYIYEKIETKD